MNNVIPFAKQPHYDNVTVVLATIPITMSSRAIAEMLDSRHDKVKQSIERLAERGTIGLPPLGEYLDSLGRAGSKEYLLDKRSSFIVVAQLSPEFTATLVDRWQELEGYAKNPAVLALPQDYIEALEQLLIAKKSEVLAIQHVAALKVVVAEQTIKVDAHNLLTDADGSMTVTEAAKNLQVKPMQLTKYLRDCKWIYKQGASYLAFQTRLDAGLMMHKITLVEVYGGGETMQRYATQARVTVKGLAKISLVFAVK